MADMLADGLAWLTDQLKAFVSQTVTYARGTSSVQVQATFGNKLLRIEDNVGNVRVEWTDMDFLIKSADLNFGGVPITPTRGDLIFTNIGTDVQIFQASPYGPNEPVWRWSDPHQSIVRIHAKHVKDQSVYT